MKRAARFYLRTHIHAYVHTEFYKVESRCVLKIKLKKKNVKEEVETARFVCERTNTLYAPAPIVHAYLYCVVEPIGDYGYKILLYKYINMYVCVCIYIYICIYAHIYIHIYMKSKTEMKLL